MFSFLISTFKFIDFLYDSIMSKKRNVNMMKQHGFYSIFVVFWLYDNQTIF
jgi:hypothetical protein